MKMNTLIQTGVCSIVYGDFRGKPNQELFRCPRGLEDKDLHRYVNEHRDVLGFEDDDTQDLREVEGRELIGYFRMYFRDGWAGSWFLENGQPDKIDCAGVQRIINWVCDTFQKGCDYKMADYFASNFKVHGDRRYVVRPIYSDYYKVMVDTKYGNGDYPVRIYAYRRAA